MDRATFDHPHLTRYAHLLYEANKRTNLVSRRLSEPAVGELVRAHADLLVRAGHPRAHEPGGLEGRRLIDVGSGGGLPGIALKIRHPELHVVLTESRKLRVACLREFVDALGLEKVDVVAGDVGTTHRHLDEQARFDTVTAFGVGQAVEVIGLVVPLARHEGIAYLSIPQDPRPADVATWHLEAAAWKRAADVLEQVLAGGRSVLRLRPLERTT